MGNTDEPLVTLRMPLSKWRGIVNGIEKSGLQDIELLDGDPSAIWWLNNYHGDPRA